MIQYQILRTSIIRIVWQTVRRITNEILGIKGFNAIFTKLYKEKIMRYRSTEYSTDTITGIRKNISP